MSSLTRASAHPDLYGQQIPSKALKTLKTPSTKANEQLFLTSPLPQYLQSCLINCLPSLYIHYMTKRMVYIHINIVASLPISN